MRSGYGWLHQSLRGRGLRLTLPRRYIINVFITQKGHLSAEDVFTRVQKLYPRTGFATVYRTLDLLRREGILRRFEFGDGRARYELADQNFHHHHLVCRQCGRIINYSDFTKEEEGLFRRIEKALEKKYDFAIDSHQLHFYGLCARCQKSKKEEL